MIFTSVLKYYRDLYPNYHIAILLQDYVAELARNCPYIDEVIAFDWRKFRRSPFYRFQLIRSLRERGFHMALHPQYSREPDGDALVQATGAHDRIGFDGDYHHIELKRKLKNDQIYTRLVRSLEPSDSVVPEIERNRMFVESLGGSTDAELHPTLWLSREDEAFADRLFAGIGMHQDARRPIVCFPGAGKEKRFWPLTHYAYVIRRVWEELNVRAILAGSAQEAGLARHIARLAEDAYPIDITGGTTVAQLAAVLERSALYVGSETGPMHMAAAVGTPTLCILGGGRFGRFFPYGDLSKNQMVYKRMDCFGCKWKCKYDTIRCIVEIEPEEVYRRVVKMLREA